MLLALFYKSVYDTGYDHGVDNGLELAEVMREDAKKRKEIRTKMNPCPRCKGEMELQEPLSVAGGEGIWTVCHRNYRSQCVLSGVKYRAKSAEEVIVFWNEGQ
jgi:hypothetical protein